MRRFRKATLLGVSLLLVSSIPSQISPKKPSLHASRSKPPSPSLEEGITQNFLGVKKMVHRRDFAGAKTNFQRAIQIFETLNKKNYAALARGNLARLYAVHGWSGEALLRLKNVLKEPELPPTSRCQALLTLSEVQRNLGRPDLALQFLDRALPLLETTADAKRIRKARLSRIILLRESGKQSEALAALQSLLSRVGGLQHLAPREKALLIPILGIKLAGYNPERLKKEAVSLAHQGFPDLAASCLLTTFHAYLRHQSFAKAKVVLRLAREYIKTAGNKQLIKAADLNEAALLLAQGKTTELFPLLQPLLLVRPRDSFWARAQMLFAKVHERKGRWEQAAQSYERAAKFYEARKSYPQALRSYAQAGIALFHANRPNKARSQSKKVQALLPLARETARNPGLSPHTNALLDSLYNYWIQSLLEDRPSTPLPSLEEKAFALVDQQRQGTLIADACNPLPPQKRQERLLSLLGKKKEELRPRMGEALLRDLNGPRPNYSFPLALPSAIQRALGPKEALLCFYLNPSTPRVWIIDQEGLHLHRPQDPQLRKRIQLWLRLLAAYPEKGSQGPLCSLQSLLATRLFGPLKKRLAPLQNLAVVSDPGFGPLPVGPLLRSLFSRKKGASSLSKLSKLSKLPNIRTLPCAGILLVPWKKKKAPNHFSKSAWIVTHPDFGPLPILREVLKKSEIRVFTFEGTLPPLPKKPPELLYIGAHGREIGKKQVLDLGSQILHPANLFRSSPRIVHLAACSSLRGRSFSFEMQEGFAKLLLSQGTHHVIGARWEVDETSIGIFDRAFYSQLPLLGAKKAFGYAIKKLQEDPRSASFFHWGSFVLFSRD